MHDIYDFNSFRCMRAYMSSFQKSVEDIFSRLTKKYDFPEPLLFTHNWILQSLYYAQRPLTLTEISREAGLSLPNVSTGIKALVNDRLVIQDSTENKRTHCMRLTEFGRIVCEDYLKNYLGDIIKKYKHGIDEDTARAAKSYLLQLEKNALELEKNR